MLTTATGKPHWCTITHFSLVLGANTRVYEATIKVLTSNTLDGVSHVFPVLCCLVAVT